MKVKIKAAFLDKDGIHKKGDVLDVKTFDPVYMTAIDEPEKVEDVKPKTTKKSKK